MINFPAPAFTGVDKPPHGAPARRAMAHGGRPLHRRRRGHHPRRTAWKKPVLLERGSFRPLTNPMLDMLERGREQFVADKSLQNDPPVVMFEMTLRQLQVGDAIDPPGFSRPCGHARRARQSRADLQFFSATTASSIISRARPTSPSPCPIGLVRLRDVMDENFTPTCRRPHGIARPAFQERRETLPSIPRSTKNPASSSPSKHGSRAAPAPSLRAPRRNKFIENITNYNADALRFIPAKSSPKSIPATNH